MADPDHPTLPLFPIQLVKVDIGEIAYSCGGFSDSDLTPTNKFDLNVSVSPFDNEAKSLQVVLTFTAKPDPSFHFDYSLSIRVHGQFQIVDEPRLPFPIEQIQKWAEKNAVLIMMPFLRESVYTITAKTGFKPLMIPMIEVTAFRVGAPNHAQAVPAIARAQRSTPGAAPRAQVVLQNPSATF